MSPCTIGIHKYTKWKDLFEGEETHMKTKASRPVLVQERECLRCGIKQRRSELL